MTVPRSYTHWTRLEPRPRDEDMADALRAEVRDPLWLLSRQWQLAEFHGDDAGSPVRADLQVEHDALTHYDLGPPGRGGGGPREYEGQPLEALVERERVLSDDDGPPARVAAEAGLYFLRLLSAHGYETGDGPYAAGDFPDDLVLTDVEGDLDVAGRRFARVMTDRVLDGQAVYDAIASAVSNVAAVAGGASPAVADAGALPLPRDGDRTEAFDAAVAEYVGYCRSLFDEPRAETGAAWRPERMEYEFAVSTGDDAETVLAATEYGGGHLDWHAFSVEADRSLGTEAGGGTAEDGGLGDEGDGVERAGRDSNERGGGAGSERREVDDAEREEGGGDAGATTTTAVTTLPTRATFPGMPAERWWEFEDAAVTLGDVYSDGASLPRLLLLEFAVQYGNDWFLLPVETPVGSLSRVTSLSLTDSFGVSRSVGPTTARTDDWNAFAFGDLPNADGPGLFVPPTLPTPVESDPVERVVLARDETANLAFGIERVVEGPVGDPVAREEFEPPSLRVDAVSPARDGDVATEFVDLENPGEDDLAVSGWEVRRVTDGEEATVFTVEDDVLPPESVLRIHTGRSGTGPSDDGRLDRYCGRSTPLWTDADGLAVYDVSDGDARLVTRKRLGRPSDSSAAYRLSTDVPDHWFPFEVDPTSPTDYRLERALLLDADRLGVSPGHLPQPRGEILEPDGALLEDGADTLRVYEEEIPPTGTEVTRSYRLAGWHTGRTHLWSGRRVRASRDEPSSGLRFDVLEEATGRPGDGTGDSSDRADSDTDGERDDAPEAPHEATGRENLVAASSYLLGWFSGLLVLAFGRDSEYVRFHAAQSVVVFGGLSLAHVSLWFAQLLVFLVFYTGHPIVDPTYHLLAGAIERLASTVWLLGIGVWVYLVAWTYRRRDPRIPVAARLADALAGR